MIIITNSSIFCWQSSVGISQYFYSDCLQCKHRWRKGKGRSKKQSKGRRGRRVRGMTLRDTPISPRLKTSPKVLKILVVGGYHPIELIMPPLGEVTKNNFLSFNIGS